MPTLEHPAVDALILKSGVPVRQQTVGVQKALLDMPESAVRKIEEMLLDSMNSVSIDFDTSVGSAVICCKNGLNISKINVTWMPNECLRQDSYSHVPEVRANPALGLRSVAAPAPRESYTAIVPGNMRNAETSTANPHLSVRSTGARGNTRKDHVLDPKEICAIPGYTLKSQPKEFGDALHGLQRSLHEDIEKLLIDANNNVSILPDSASGTAKVICRNGARMSTLDVSWSPDINHSHSQSVTPHPFPPVLSSAPTPTPINPPAPPSACEYTHEATADSPGSAVASQNKEFREAVGLVPQGLRDRIADLLKDTANFVTLQLNIDEGVARITSRNGNRISTLNASWPPAMPERYDPPPVLPSLTASGERPNDPELRADPSLGLRSATCRYTHDVTAAPGAPLSAQNEEFQEAASRVPSALQGRIEELMQDTANVVNLQLNIREGIAKVTTKNGLRTSTLNASWDPVLLPPPRRDIAVSHNPVAVTNAPAVKHTPMHSVSQDHQRGEHANPSLGLRSLW